MEPVPHAGWTAARDAVLQAFAKGEHIAALLGPAGVGKTLLLRELEAALRARSIRVLRLDHGDGAEGALEAAPDTEALLIDEADRMGEAALEEAAERRGCFTVLVGLPVLARRIAPWPHRVVELLPLPAAEVPSYLAARMAGTGLRGTRLTEEAGVELAGLSGGTPRLLNTLLAMAFHEADMTDAVEVRAEHVRDAAALRAEMPERNPAPETAPAEPAPPDPPPCRETGTTLRAPPAAEASPPASPASPRTLSLAVAPGTASQARSRRPAAILAGTALLLLGGLAWLEWRKQADTTSPEVVLPRAATPAAEAERRAEGPAPPAAVSSKPAMAEAAQAPGLPDGALVRVVITYPRGVAEAGRRGAALSAALGQAGVSAGAPFPVSRPPTGPEVSYFFREDRDAALRVRGMGGLEGALPVLGSTAGTAPRPGTIEVALSTPGATGEERDGPLPEDAAPGWAPPPAVPVYPPAGAALTAGAASRGLLMTWAATEARPGCCFVEVMFLGGPGTPDGPPREAFAAYAEAPEQQLVQLPAAGSYAWRVLTVSAAARRYTASPWRHFVLGAAPS
ncbi:hypothetical protein [Muricoccus vinaceus]|uniref:AAA+ ATPase domain-containing protein n=1 Tax=Muricoccus vinaceus TaxID=424704 RepID=A0ABV6IKA7_9PROT